MKFDLHHYDVLESTNAAAAKAAADGAAEGTVIIAARQIGGHGRMQRVWNSPVGGLWFSVILRPEIAPEDAAQLTLLAGVAVNAAIRQLYNTDKIMIKWPNDLLLKGKKVCGILSELQLKANGDIDYAVIGIGINVALKEADFPEDLRRSASALNSALSQEFTCDEVLSAVLNEMDFLYGEWLAEGSKAILPLWKKLNCTLGNEVRVKDNDQVIFTGIAVSIDEQGALLVKNKSGIVQTFDFGEISIR